MRLLVAMIIVRPSHHKADLVAGLLPGISTTKSRFDAFNVGQRHSDYVGFQMKKLLPVACLSGILTLPVMAGEADVVDVSVTGSGTSYQFSVTLRHDDTGWEHYADAWEVVGRDGTVYGKRVLYHPHVDER